MRRSFLYLLFLLVCFCAAVTSKCQLLPGPDTRFDNFSQKYNLARQFCMDVITDSAGYVWAMNPGIYRFDGRQVKYYTSYNNQQHGLRDSYAEHPVVDYKGRLWIGSAAGLHYYDAVHDKFNYVYPQNSSAAEYAYSACISGKELFFRNKDGLCRLDLETLEIKNTTLKTLSTWYCFADNKKNIIVCTDVEYFVYNPAKDTYKKFSWQKDGITVRIKDIVYANNRYWLATNKGLWQTTSFYQLPAPVTSTHHLNIQSLALMPVTADSLLWLGTGGEGLQLLHTATERIVYHYKNDPLNPLSLPSDNIISLHTDKHGRLWLCTEEGISLLNPYNQFFRQHLLQTGNDISIYRFIYNIIPHRTKTNTVWINQYGTGLIEFDWKEKKNLRVFTVTAEGEKPFYHRNFRAALQLKNGDWALGNNDRLLIWNEKKGIQKIVTVFGLPDNLPQLTIKHFIEVADTVFILTQNGLLKYIKGETKATVVFYRDKSKEYNSGTVTNGFYDKKHEQIWMSSYEGLICYSLATGQKKIYRIQHSDSINSNVMLNILKASDGNFYCSLRNGISIFNPQTKQFSVINRFGSIINPQCFGIEKVNGLFYINSNAGLIQYNMQTMQAALVNSCTPFTLIYSLQPVYRVYNDIAILFNESFAYFNPSDVKLFSPPTSPVLEEINLNNRRIATTANSSFSRKENNISFRFTAFDFNNPANICFRYRLLSKDTTWILTEDEQRSATYLGLSPGSYKFEVQSGNKNGSWNTHSAVYAFKINPAFWQTAWFKAGSILLLTGILAMLYLVRINRLKIRQQEKNRIEQSLLKKELELSQTNRQLAESELTMLRSQMNPHFIFNSLNSVQKYIWENKEEDAAEYLAKFAKLMRAILENSRKDLVTLKEEIDVLKIYIELEHRRSNGQFDYSIKTEETLNRDATMIPPMLMQPFIENSIWHGLNKKQSKGNLAITIKRQGDKLICIIDDDGVGRQPKTQSSPEEKKSLGIEITQQRINRLMETTKQKASIEIFDKTADGMPAGTTVTITLPLQII